jgi:hypothetical protein
MNNHEAVCRLLEAMDQYNPYYDEVFWEVSSRIRTQGEAGKLDLAALISWKRSGQGSWVLDLMELPDSRVRRCSRPALLPGLTDQQRLDALAVLPGFHNKSSMATAVLACHDQNEFGVLDRRALNGLENIKHPIERGRGETLRYLDRLRQLRDLVRQARPNATARNVDQGLWIIGSQ